MNKINLLNSIEIDIKSFVLINLSILFISFYFLANAFMYKKTNLDINYGNLPHTTFQVKAILNDLTTKTTKIKKLKKELQIISSTPLKSSEYFLKLKFNKGFEIEIKTKRNLDFYFKKYFIVKSSLQNDIYKATLK